MRQVAARRDYGRVGQLSIIGGGGSNATAVAQASGGTVTNVMITDAGVGYTNEPEIYIAPPPATALTPVVEQAMKLDLNELSAYDNYLLQFEPQLAGPWTNWPGLFVPTAITNTQYVIVSNSAGFFRLVYSP